MLSACGPSLKTLELRQAEQAKARKDWVVAAGHLKRACELDPKDQKVCTEAEKMAHHAVDDSITAAKREIERGEYESALAHLVRARPVDERGKVGPVLDTLGDKFAERCNSLPLQNTPEAVRYTRCLEANRAAIDRQRYSQIVAEGRVRASDLAAREAASNASEQRYATAYVQSGVAECLQSSADVSRHKGEYFSHFFERVSIPLGTRVQLPWSTPGISHETFCRERAAEHPLLDCQGTLHDRTLGVDLVVESSKQRHTQRGEARQIDYVDRIERYPNPAWAPLQSQLAREQRALQRERSQKNQLEANCETAESALRRAQSCNQCPERTHRDGACNNAEAARRTLRDHEQDVDRLRYELNNTPRELEREIMATFNYTEYFHSYSQSYRFSGTTTSYGARTPANDEGTLEVEVSEHIGFAKAGLASKPLDAPSPTQFREEITARAKGFMARMVQSDLQKRSNDRLQQCSTPNDPTQLECWLAAHALVVDPLQPYTARISEQIGRTYPATGCK